MHRPNLLTLLVIFALAASTACHSKEAPTTPIAPPDIADQVLQATLHELSGAVEARQAVADEFAPAEDGMVLELGGQVATKEDGRARLDLSTGTLVRLTPLTTFTLETNGIAPQGGLLTRFKLETGKIWIILRGGQMDVDTPSGLASVRGSYLSVEVLPDGTMEITCLEGTCRLENAAGSVELTAGQKATVKGPNDPPKSGVMSEADIQEWLDENPEAILVIPTLTALPTEPPPATEAVATEPVVTEPPIPTETPVTPSPIPYVPPPPTKKPPKPATTEAPVNTPSTITIINGPTGEIMYCDNSYYIDVIDPDGIDTVQIKFTVFDGSVPVFEYMVNAEYDGEAYYYNGAVDTIMTGTQTVVWKVMVYDIPGSLTTGTENSFTDPLDCSSQPY